MVSAFRNHFSHPPPLPPIRAFGEAGGVMVAGGKEKNKIHRYKLIKLQIYFLKQIVADAIQELHFDTIGPYDYIL